MNETAPVIRDGRLAISQDGEQIVMHWTAPSGQILNTRLAPGVLERWGVRLIRQQTFAPRTLEEKAAA